MIGLLGPVAALATGCGDDGGSSSDGEGGEGAGQSSGGGGSPAEPVVEILNPGAEPLAGQSECEVVITTQIPSSGQMHVDPCTPVTYATNPPSSGDHWPVWAQYQEYDEPIPREMYVHSLEHGAVVLLHDCPGCPDVVPALRAAVAELGADPLCVQVGLENRTIIAPDDQIPTPIALAAWGATYTATCIDPPSLAEFVVAGYAHGPENTCAPGKDPTDPLGGAPICD
jgi:hypothetical protein